MSTPKRAPGPAEVIMLALREMSEQSRSRDDCVASTTLSALLNAHWQISREPRTFRVDTPEPGDDVRAVLDAENALYYRGRGGAWLGTSGGLGNWAHPTWTWPVVEVILPNPGQD